MKSELKIIDYGISDYREIWENQKRFFQTLVDLKQNHEPVSNEYLLLGEHPPVYTLGFHGNKDNLLVSEVQLSASGTEVIRIERGGDITFHGPGQLVVYPIIDLDARNLTVKDYMWHLEECIIRLIRKYGLKGERIDGATGVWIGEGTPDERKICAMGVRCRRHVTMHGLALNVSTDLSAFSLINPCGFITKGVTSIQKELQILNKEETTPSMESVKNEFVEIFKALF